MEVPCCDLTHQMAPTADRWRSLAGRLRSLAVTSHTPRRPPQQTDGGPLLSPHTPDGPSPQQTDGGPLLSLHTPDSPPPLTPSQQQKTKPDGGPLLSLHTPDSLPPPPPSPLTAADRARWRSVAIASHTRQLERVC